MSSEKQKALDRSTSWSKDQWDKEEQLWYRSRKDEWGQTERCYPYDGQAIPRAFGYNDSTTTEDTGINYSDYSQVTANSLYQQPGAISPTGNLEQSTQYTPSYTTANTSSYHSGAYFNTSTYSNHLGGSDQASFYESPPIASASADGIAQDIGNLSFRRQSTIPEHEDGDIQDIAVKHIRKEPNSGPQESLDTRYKVIPEKKQKDFWVAGRVFMMLWTEPASVLVPRNGGTRNGSHFSTTWLNGDAYSEIRRFVVIKANWGSNICSPIHTYSNQATLKPNLPHRTQHAVIYTDEHPPEERSYVATDGTEVREELSLDPIKVNRQQKGSEGNLGNFSRVNFSKIYTVENYVRVLNIGMVDPSSLYSLEANSYLKSQSDPVERPRARKPPADSKQRHPNGKESKGKKKDHRKRS